MKSGKYTAYSLLLLGFPRGLPSLNLTPDLIRRLSHLLLRIMAEAQCRSLSDAIRACRPAHRAARPTLGFNTSLSSALSMRLAQGGFDGRCAEEGHAPTDGEDTIEIHSEPRGQAVGGREENERCNDEGEDELGAEIGGNVVVAFGGKGRLGCWMKEKGADVAAAI